MAHAASYIRDVVSNGTNFNLPGSRWHKRWNESDQREPETSTLTGSALDNSSTKFASRRKCPIPLSTHAHLQSDTSPTRQLLARERNVPHLRRHPLHHQQLYSPASSTDDFSSLSSPSPTTLHSHASSRQPPTTRPHRLPQHHKVLAVGNSKHLSQLFI